MVRGSVAQSDSLQQDFTTIVEQPLLLGNGSSTFGWTPMSDSKGTVTWNLDVEMAQFGEGTLSAYLWVVEGSAYFEEGSNGLGDYPHIVRDIIHLGNDTQGSMSVDLPATFDGDDLSVHLIYQFNPLIPEEPVVPTPVVDEETVPFLSSISTLAMVGVAVAVRRS